MVKGFYMAASGMLTQSKNLNTISNNLANVSTPGYKSDLFVSQTFEEVLLARTGNTNRSNTEIIGSTSTMLTPSTIHTIHNQGTIEQTDRKFDFALRGEGFFRISTNEGDVFTRNGSFTLDETGHLALQHIGRVQGKNGDIYIGTDNFTSNADGSIDIANEFVDTIDIIDFNDYNLIYKTNEGMFVNTDIQNEIESDTHLINGAIERSNIESADELTNMLVAQRSIQSCSQILKMYDEMLAKTVTEIGKV